jgi:subtilase family serine protease
MLLSRQAVRLSWACIAVLALELQPATAFGSTAVAPLVQRAQDLGAVNPSKDMKVTVYLNVHNQAAYDQAVANRYDPASPYYHQWMSDADFAAFAPTKAEMAVVQAELQRHGLTVISTDPQNFSVRVEGSAANVQAAFQTQIHNLALKEKTIFAHVTPAQLTGAAGSLVQSIAGLDQGNARNLYKVVKNPKTGASPAPIALSSVLASGGLGSIITSNCVKNPKTENYTTPGALLPTASYYGNLYNPGSNSAGTPLTCGFTAAELQSHYGLNAAYNKGFDGTGQTIVLLEAYGTPFMMQDANAFNSLMGLPLLTSANFKVVYPEGVPNQTLAYSYGWDVEISLDIQWAHAMAPGAKIVVVAAYTQENEDLEYCMKYIVSNHLGYVVSDSWEVDQDADACPAEQDDFNNILKKAAAQGISFNFSSGDGGDEGLGTPVGASLVPSNAPYATGVGGTSIFNNPNGAGQLETGWGTNFTYIAFDGPFDPPLEYGFQFGAGGGQSAYFEKPKWQKTLSGTGRQSPDVSALADPYTGVPLIVTEQGTQYLYVGIGGTSLASPIFSAIWAIAQQKAGGPLGQAAPIIAALSSTTVTDIVPPYSPTNVSGTIKDSFGSFFYPAASLLSGLDNTQGFLSAIYPDPYNPGPQGQSGILGFGIDTSLTVTVGWDNVTGYGVPNGLPFIKAAAAQ